MIRFEVGPADVAGIRFGTSAVWEATASLHALVFPREHALHARLSALVPRHPDFDLPLLAELAGHPRWIPDTLSPQPSGEHRSALEEIRALAATEPTIVARDLETARTLCPEGRVAGMTPEQYLVEVTEALSGYWQRVLEPLWERVDAITRADIAFHSQTFSRLGLGACLGGIHDELSFADGALQVNMMAEGSVQTTGNGIWLVPCVFRWPWVAVDHLAPAPVICYGARGSGLVWESASGSSDVLGSLIGRSRAVILESLDIGRTTTGLAARLGLSMGTVSEHLSVLQASRLVDARREGRRVLYTRTRLGCDLVVGGAVMGRRSG